MTGQPAPAAGDRDEDLARKIAAFHDDPLGFVEFVFPWGAGPLAGADGPDTWQRQLLSELGGRIADAASPVRMAVASGHGVGKTALSAWLILWFLSTRDHPQLVVTANPLASALQVRVLPPAPSRPSAEGNA